MEVSLEEVIALCTEAGDAIQVLSENTTFENKADGSPVTAADLLSNEIICAGLQRSGIPILSEESPESFKDHRDGRIWVVDPLDGTSAFIAGEAEWAVMVGLLENGAPIMGVVYAPALGKLWSAQRGNGAFCDAKKLRMKMGVSNARETRGATLLLSKNHFSEEAHAVAEKLGAHAIRTSGLGVKVCRVAEGSADMYWSEARLGEWDVCAPQIILEEAGGLMTDAAGNEIVYGSGEERHVPGVAASNDALHPMLAEVGRNVLGMCS